MFRRSLLCSSLALSLACAPGCAPTRTLPAYSEPLHASFGIGMVGRCSLTEHDDEPYFECDDMFELDGDASFTCTDGRGALAADEARAIAVGLLRIFARVRTRQRQHAIDETRIAVVFREGEHSDLVWLHDLDVEDVDRVLAPVRSACGLGDPLRAHGTAWEASVADVQRPQEDFGLTEDVSTEEADPGAEITARCPERLEEAGAVAVPESVANLLALPETQALRMLATAQATALTGLRDVASAGMDERAARARDLLIAHYRARLRRHPWVIAHRTLVTQDGELAPTATAPAIALILDAGDATLVPLVADGLAREDLRVETARALRDADRGLPMEIGAVLVPSMIALLAHEADGNLGSMLIGSYAQDPAAVYLHAIEQQTISANGLGWMWGGIERSSPRSRRALLDYVLTTMLDDHREIAEIDGTTNRTRTVADVGFGLLEELAGLRLRRFRDERELRTAASSVRRWWSACGAGHP